MFSKNKETFPGAPSRRAHAPCPPLNPPHWKRVLGASWSIEIHQNLPLSFVREGQMPEQTRTWSLERRAMAICRHSAVSGVPGARYDADALRSLTGQVCRGCSDPAFDISPSGASDGVVFKCPFYLRSSSNPHFSLTNIYASSGGGGNTQKRKEGTKERTWRKEEAKREANVSSASSAYISQRHCRAAGARPISQAWRLRLLAHGRVTVGDQGFRRWSRVCICSRCHQTVP